MGLEIHVIPLYINYTTYVCKKNRLYLTLTQLRIHLYFSYFSISDLNGTEADFDRYFS